MRDRLALLTVTGALAAAILLLTGTTPVPSERIDGSIQALADVVREGVAEPAFASPFRAPTPGGAPPGLAARPLRVTETGGLDRRAADPGPQLGRSPLLRWCLAHSTSTSLA